jgi:deoxyhypusine monooxygenase
MGAISSEDSLPILRQYLNDSNRSVRETCEIAVAKIEWDHTEEGRHNLASVAADPTPLARMSLGLV